MARILLHPVVLSSESIVILEIDRAVTSARSRSAQPGEQRVHAALVLVGEDADPAGLGEHVLEHQGVDVPPQAHATAWPASQRADARGYRARSQPEWRLVTRFLTGTRVRLRPGRGVEVGRTGSPTRGRCVRWRLPPAAPRSGLPTRVRSCAASERAGNRWRVRRLRSARSSCSTGRDARAAGAGRSRIPVRSRRSSARVAQAFSRSRRPQRRSCARSPGRG